MHSLDTNVLVRYYTNDDPAQSPLAAKLLEEQGPLLVPLSVLLELVWVLQSHCELPKSRLLLVLRHLLALEALRLQNHDAVVAAVDYFAAGLEFEDALHLALAADSKTFWTFDDKGFARKANKLGLAPTCAIPGQ